MNRKLSATHRRGICVAMTLLLLTVGGCDLGRWQRVEYDIEVNSFEFDNQTHPAAGTEYYRSTGRPLISFIPTHYGSHNLSYGPPYKIKLSFREESADKFDKVRVENFELKVGAQGIAIKLVASPFAIPLEQRTLERWEALYISETEVNPVESNGSDIYVTIEYALLKDSRKIGDVVSETYKFGRNESSGVTSVPWITT